MCCAEFLGSGNETASRHGCSFQLGSSLLQLFVSAMVQYNMIGLNLNDTSEKVTPQDNP